MFDKITPAERGELARTLLHATIDTLSEVTSAVKLGRVQFDALYGYGRAEQYVHIAGELALQLTELALVATPATV